MPNNEMTAIEIARRLAELGRGEEALKAYSLALSQKDTAPADRFEAACAVLQYGEDYRPAYDAFLELHQVEALRTDALSILTDAFYLPNEDQMREQYEKNCKLLSKYPYLFRQDFLPFEELPIRFYPYDDNGVIPYHTGENRFEGYTDLNEPVIRHYFFRDLEKPVLAENIVSQYELEYLNDNVRRSDWVAKDNHVYLHYTDWGVFCAYLQVWDMKPLLKDSKLVFLIGDEIAQYPIDFKERFGIDYSQYRVKPVGIREVNKIIWHTQLYAHNGGDFFNEMLHGHPYLLADSSAMFDKSRETFHMMYITANEIAKSKGKKCWSAEMEAVSDMSILSELVVLPRRTEKDAIVAYYLAQKQYTRHLDPNSRIVPAIIYQPHFGAMGSVWDLHETGAIIAHCDTYDMIRNSGLLQQFKYIKVFTPMRRPTNSHAATVRYMYRNRLTSDSHQETSDNGETSLSLMGDALFDRILNRSFMIDPTDRLMMDSRVVRFEDGKLNPKATFTALAAFLDVPYTESMTYCSDDQGKNPVYEGVAIGLDTAPIYRTYEEHADEYERRLLEYVLRDAYAFYGYDFNYYDGKPMEQEEVEALLEKCETNLELVRKSWWDAKWRVKEKYGFGQDELDEKVKQLSEENVEKYKSVRRLAIRFLRHGLKFCSKDGTLLRMTELLELDPSLLENPVYH